jgi:hypothetical protein
MEKQIVIGTHVDAAQADREFWFNQTPADRIRHVLELRRINYGTDRVSARLQRVLEVIDRPRR